MNTNTIGTLSFLAGAAVGAYVGYQYFVARERKFQEAFVAFEEEYAKGIEEMHEANLEGLRTEYEAIVTEMEYAPAKEELVEAMQEDLLKTLDVMIEEAQPRTADGSLFVQSATVPYLVTEEEAFESDFELVALSYYEGDDTLADSSDNVVGDLEGHIGGHTLKGFGMCEGLDDDVIYVMNESKNRLYEVHRYEASYAEFVLGLRPEFLEGAKHHKVHRMRRE